MREREGRRLVEERSDLYSERGCWRDVRQDVTPHTRYMPPTDQMRLARRVLDSYNLPEPFTEPQFKFGSVSLYFCRSFSTPQRWPAVLLSVAVQSLARPLTTSDSASHVYPCGPKVPHALKILAAANSSSEIYINARGVEVDEFSVVELCCRRLGMLELFHCLTWLARNANDEAANA
jgi:hypothetical protein